MCRVLIFFLCSVSVALGQESAKDKNFEIGISYYRNGNIDDAYYFLNKSLFQHNNPETRYYLGLVTISKGDYGLAKRHFSQSFKNDSTQYYLAMIEKLQGNFDQAKSYFEGCRWRDAEKQADDCIELKKINRRVVKIRNIESLNSVYSEVSPAIFNSKILFSSDREKVLMKQKDIISSHGYYDFYESEINANNYQQPKKSSLGINTGQHELQPVFNTTFDTLYYCHSASAKSEEGKVVLPKLYRVTCKDEKWDKPKDFLLNDTMAAFSHPFISRDGQLFLFSSNMAGGIGGADLYICYKQDTAWSFPINLGSLINTLGDEVSPYLVGDTLYFASNGHASFGGYDIFKSILSDGLFQQAENMGKPINSSFNDFYPVILDDEKWIIVSDRVGGKGKEDLYEVVFLK